MRHRVQPHGDQIAEPMVGIDGGAVIIVGADAGGKDRQLLRLRHLGHEVDRPADRSRSVEHRIGAVIDLDLLEIERIGAAVLGAVANTVDGDVVARRIAAQVDRVAIAAAALAGAEGNPRDGGESVAKGQQILPAKRLIGDDGDGLRGVDDVAGRLGRFERLGAELARDDDLTVRALLHVRLGGILACESGRRQEADATERQRERGPRLAGADSGNDHAIAPCHRAGSPGCLSRYCKSFATKSIRMRTVRNIDESGAKRRHSLGRAVRLLRLMAQIPAV